MKFKLHIELGWRKNAARSASRDKVWECVDDVEFDPGPLTSPLVTRLDGLPGKLSGYRIRERTLLKASLEVPREWLDETFVLQVGMDPDSCIRFSRRSYENGVMIGDDNDRSDVFYDTMGPTFLSLIDERTKKPLLVIKLEVNPDPLREEMMRGVVAELTTMAPHALCSASDWQNYSAFVDGRQSGAASFSSPEIEFNAVLRLMNELVPVLRSISLAPAWRVVKVRRRVDIAQARSLPKSSSKRIAPCFAKKGNLVGLPKRLDAYVFARSCDVKAHRVIAAFLTSLSVRLNRIYILSKKQIEKYTEEIEECEYRCSQIPNEKVRRKSSNVYKHSKDELQKYRKAIEDILPRLKQEIAKLSGIRDLYIFRSQILRPQSQFSSQDFEFDERYRRCFFLMVDYENGHHWWKPLEDGQGWTHSLDSIERGRFGNSLQRKYSILFEYWSYFRLLDAFEANGFDFADARKKIRERMSKSIVIECEEGSFEPIGTRRDGDDVLLEVQIIHNYSAYSPIINPTARFKTTQGGLDEDGRSHSTGGALFETPDIAVVMRVMRNKRTVNWFWFTMDAKSTSSLRKYQVIKQNNYLNHLHTPKFDLERECRPLASWLIYAGSLHGVAGLENIKNEDVSLREWNPDDEDAIVDMQRGQQESGIECSVAEGLRLNKKSDRQFMGQIRANPKTSPLSPTTSNRDGVVEPSPFFNFARMMINTARNYYS